MTRVQPHARHLAGIAAFVGGALLVLAALPAPAAAPPWTSPERDCKPRPPVELTLASWSALGGDAVLLQAVAHPLAPVESLAWRVEAPAEVVATLRPSADEHEQQVELRSSAPPAAGQVDLVLTATLAGGEVVETRRSLRWGTPAPSWQQRLQLQADGHEQVRALVPASHREGR